MTIVVHGRRALGFRFVGVGVVIGTRAPSPLKLVLRRNSFSLAAHVQRTLVVPVVWTRLVPQPHWSSSSPLNPTLQVFVSFSSDVETRELH